MTNLKDLIIRFFPKSFRDLVVSATLGGMKMEMAKELKNLLLMQLLISIVVHRASKYI